MLEREPGFSRVTNRHALTPPNGSLSVAAAIKISGKVGAVSAAFFSTIGRKIWRGCQAGPSPYRLDELQKADSWQEEPDGRQRRRLAGQAGL